MRYYGWTERIEWIVRLFYMECQRFRLKAGMTCMFAAAWWGVLYPELCFTEETCQAVITADGETDLRQSDGLEAIEQTGEEQLVQRDAAQQIAVQKENTQQTISRQTYREILEATGNDVVVKSRFLEWLEECMED